MEKKILERLSEAVAKELEKEKAAALQQPTIK